MNAAASSAATAVASPASCSPSATTNASASVSVSSSALTPTTASTASTASTLLSPPLKREEAPGTPNASNVNSPEKLAQQQLLGATAKPEPVEWTCLNCTLSNTASSHVCAKCGSQKEALATPTAKTTTTTIRPSSPSNDSSDSRHASPPSSDQEGKAYPYGLPPKYRHKRFCPPVTSGNNSPPSTSSTTPSPSNRSNILPRHSSPTTAESGLPEISRETRPVSHHVKKEEDRRPIGYGGEQHNLAAGIKRKRAVAEQFAEAKSSPSRQRPIKRILMEDDDDDDQAEVETKIAAQKPRSSHNVTYMDEIDEEDDDEDEEDEFPDRQPRSSISRDGKKRSPGNTNIHSVLAQLGNANTDSTEDAFSWPDRVEKVLRIHGGKGTGREVREWVLQSFPEVRKRNNWESSIRSCLSNNRRFLKAGYDGNFAVWKLRTNNSESAFEEVDDRDRERERSKEKNSREPIRSTSMPLGTPNSPSPTSSPHQSPQQRGSVNRAIRSMNAPKTDPQLSSARVLRQRAPVQTQPTRPRTNLSTPLSRYQRTQGDDDEEEDDDDDEDSSDSQDGLHISEGEEDERIGKTSRRDMLDEDEEEEEESDYEEAHKHRIRQSLRRGSVSPAIANTKRQIVDGMVPLKKRLGGPPPPMPRLDNPQRTRGHVNRDGEDAANKKRKRGITGISGTGGQKDSSTWSEKIDCVLREHGGRGTCENICKWVATAFPKALEGKENWRRTISACLSVDDSFVKGQERVGKGVVWALRGWESPTPHTAPLENPRGNIKTEGPNNNSNNNNNSAAPQGHQVYSQYKASENTDNPKGESDDDNGNPTKRRRRSPEHADHVAHPGNYPPHSDGPGGGASFSSGASSEEGGYSTRGSYSSAPGQQNPKSSSSTSSTTSTNLDASRATTWPDKITVAMLQYNGEATAAEICDYIQDNFVDDVARRPNWKNVVRASLSNSVRFLNVNKKRGDATVWFLTDKLKERMGQDGTAVDQREIERLIRKRKNKRKESKLLRRGDMTRWAASAATVDDFEPSRSGVSVAAIRHRRDDYSDSDDGIIEDVDDDIDTGDEMESDSENDIETHYQGGRASHGSYNRHSPRSATMDGGFLPPRRLLMHIDGGTGRRMPERDYNDYVPIVRNRNADDSRYQIPPAGLDLLSLADVAGSSLLDSPPASNSKPQPPVMSIERDPSPLTQPTQQAQLQLALRGPGIPQRPENSPINFDGANPRKRQEEREHHFRHLFAEGENDSEENFAFDKNDFEHENEDYDSYEDLQSAPDFSKPKTIGRGKWDRKTKTRWPLMIETVLQRNGGSGSIQQVHKWLEQYYPAETADKDGWKKLVSAHLSTCKKFARRPREGQHGGLWYICEGGEADKETTDKEQDQEQEEQIQQAAQAPIEQPAVVSVNASG